MFTHILIPTDGSGLSQKAIKNAIQFARESSAWVTGLTVSEPFHYFVADPMMVMDTEDRYKTDCDKRARKYLDVIRKEAETAGVRCETMHVFGEHAYSAIIDTAKQQHCDLICMASHGRKGMSALVLGSETTKVLTHSKIPVLVWR
jgi:nucleotide-binding universal stress UspA family protein